MKDTNMEEQPRGGKLVALEGDIDMISTQLRLLPPSRNILVLPSFVVNLESKPSQQPFDARIFIRDVYVAFAERTETAQSFLKHSTLEQPRLVFMNGASVCARSTCILKISKMITNGDFQEAETIFNDIAQYGVASLLAEEGNEEEEAVSEEEERTLEGESPAPLTESNIGTTKHPNVSSINTFDAVGNATPAPQSSVISIELYHTPREHNNETAVTDSTAGISEVHLNSSEPEPETEPKSLTFASASRLPLQQTQPSGENSVTTGLAFQDQPRSLEPPTGQGRRHSLNETRKSGYFGNDLANDVEFEEDDTLLSIPPSPGVVYGEAELVDIQTSTSEKQSKRAKSADMSYANRPRCSTNPQIIPVLLRHSKPTSSLGRPASSVGFGANGFEMLPRRTFIRASETTIKKSPSSTRSSSSVSDRDVKASECKSQALSVDQSTDAEVILEEESGKEEYEEYVPIFPLIEDLIIHFSDSNQNKVVESVIQSYKNGSYPAMPPLPESISNRSSSLEHMVHYDTDDNRSDQVLDSTPQSERIDPGYESQHSYDPYSSKHRSHVSLGTKEAWPPLNRISGTSSGVKRSDSQMQLPNRHLTTPPNGIAEKFVEFSTAHAEGTIFLQNSLRELLSRHLPAGDSGYHQYPYQFSPEADRLWKPVFRNDDNSSLGNEGRTVDQVICLGCEVGVQKEFFGQISGHIERLGMKKDGVSRSSKLDITYLIANMMQSYSSLPLTVQSTFNPLSDSTLLATLLIPQIEAYLASNAATRLLILHYPPSHLCTVFALRQLLGAETLKIAVIQNSLSSDPPSSVSRPRTPISKYNSNTLLGEPVIRLRQRISHAESLRAIDRKTPYANTTSQPRSFSEQKPVSKTTSLANANYLLPSTATDSEITTFLSDIWKCLIDKSSFYAPEPDPEPMIVERLLDNGTPLVPLEKSPPPRQPSERSLIFKERREKQIEAERLERDSNYPPLSSWPTPPIHIPNRESKARGLTGSPKKGVAPSITSVKTNSESRAENAKFLASSGGVDNRSLNNKGERRPDGTWENFYIGDEDSDDDEFDKMILGREHAKIVPEAKKVGGPELGVKRNKQKALKWLGLS